jgi:hypothetical protein
MRKFVTPAFILMAGGMIAGLPILEASADAQRGGGRSGGASAGNRSTGASAGNRSSPQVRSQSSSSVNRGTQSASRGNQNVDRSTNVNRNTNVNVDRNVNVDIDNDWDNDYNDYDRHPVARGAAIAATTAIVVGATYRTLPPACAPSPYGGVTYYSCGGAWYQPRYVGSSVEYIVVNQPY